MSQQKQTPQGWIEVSLGDVIELKYGKALPAKLRDGEHFPVYGSNGIVGYHSEPIVNGPALIVGRKGSIGEVHLSEKDCSPIDTTYFVDEFHGQPPSFWLHRLRCLNLADLNRATALPGLNRNDAYQLTLLLPPLKEQCRIAEKAEALKARSNKARKALGAIPSLLEKFRQSVLSSAFRGDLTADWRAQKPDIEPAEKLLERIRKERRKRWEEDELAKMKAKGKTPKDEKWKKKYKEPEPVDTTDLPELPVEWCWASIDQITYLVTKGASPRWQGFEYCNEGIPFVRSQNIGWGHLLLGNIEYVDKGLNDKQARSIIQKEDVLLNIVGASIGRAAISEAKITGGNCNQAVAIIRLIPKGLNPKALMNYLISADAQNVIHDGKVDVARANYSLADIRNMAVPVPPENEQKLIEEKLSKLIAFSKAAAAKCDDAKDLCGLLDQSILSKAFRGELVPQDPTDEPASQLLKRIKQEKASLEPGKKKRARRGGTTKGS